MTASIFDVLAGKDTAQSLPEGEGVYSNKGFVGPFVAMVVYQFYSTEKLSLYDTEFKLNQDYVVRGQEGSFFYYFFDRDKAEEARLALDVEYPSRRMWKFEMPMNTVLNPPTNADKWGEVISSECNMTTLGSTMRRHEFHMITLPSLVDAIARMAGFIKERIWHIDEVLNGMPDEEFTEKFEHKMIGDADANADDYDAFGLIMAAVDNDLDLAQEIALGNPAVTPPEQVKDMFGSVKIHYKWSVLWLRRIALWKALGEEIAERYIPEGYALTDAGKNQETTSQQLSMCLRFTVEKWNSPLWGRLHLCKDPREGAVYSGNKRLSVPVISELYADEAHAKAELGDDSTTPEKPKAKTQSNTPPVPADWGEEAKDEWMAILSQQKEQVNGELPGIPGLVKLAAQLSATVDDIKAWWELV